MRKLTIVLSCCAVSMLLTLFAACTSEQDETDSYAEDRAAIEDLQARYMFALDFKDVDAYLSTFTPDGILDIGTGEIKGYEAIRKIIGGMPNREEAKPSGEAAKLRPAAGRHNISNIVIKVAGDKASGRAYWFHYGNNNPQRTATLDSYGHYVDEMVKVNGKWLFSKRRIYNEQVAEWAAPQGNPAW